MVEDGGTPWVALSREGERWFAGSTELADGAALEALVDGQPRAGELVRVPRATARWPAGAYLAYVEHDFGLHAVGGFHPLAIGAEVRIRAAGPG